MILIRELRLKLINLIALGKMSNIWFYVLLLPFLLAGCDNNDKPSEVTVYYITCTADYDRWIDSDALMESMDARKTVVKISNDKQFKEVIESVLPTENWVKHDYPRIDLRILLEVKLISGDTLLIGLDPRGNIMFEGSVYHPIPKLNEAICGAIEEIDCFCKNGMPWLDKDE